MDAKSSAENAKEWQTRVQSVLKELQDEAEQEMKAERDAMKDGILRRRSSQDLRSDDDCSDSPSPSARPSRTRRPSGSSVDRTASKDSVWLGMLSLARNLNQWMPHPARTSASRSLQRGGTRVMVMLRGSSRRMWIF